MRPHRLSPQQYVGFNAYFLTICTHKRRAVFTDRTAIGSVWSHFRQVALAEQFAVSAYCFMPDHLHVVATATAATADLTRFVRLSKQRSGFAYTRQTGARLWQESYFERTLRDEEHPAELIAYVVNNPVRAGLVDTPAGYPHWGSETCSREEILEFLAAERNVGRV